MSESLEKVYLGTFVHTPTLGRVEILQEHLEPLSLFAAVDRYGFIAYVGPANDPHSKKILDGARSVQVIPRGSFILPTFVDLHLHAPQFLYIGTGLHLPLMQWLDKYAFKAEEQIDNDEQLARTVYNSLAESLIEYGTGAALLFGTLKERSNLILAEVFQARRIRGFIGKLSMDISTRPSYKEASAQKSIEAADRFVESCNSITSQLEEHERFVQPVITPRFVPTCSDDLLLGLGSLAQRRSVLCQTHMSESSDQMELVRKERGQDDIEILDRSGLLNKHAILAHCTYSSIGDLRMLHTANASIAHCPLSNIYFSLRPFPLREALDEGVKVGLGSDVSGGYSLDLMVAMRTAVCVSKMRQAEMGRGTEGSERPQLSIDWKESLFLSTAGGAEVLSKGKGNPRGRFEVGAPFDAQRINLISKSAPFGVGPLRLFQNLECIELDESLVEKWWSIGDHRNRSHVWIQGGMVLGKE